MATHTLDLSVSLLEAEDCSNCAERLRALLVAVAGVTAAQLDIEGRRLHLSYRPEIVSSAQLEQRAQEAGLVLTRRFSHGRFRLKGMHCAGCGRALEHALGYELGVLAARASYTAGRLSVEYDPRLTDPRRIAAALGRLGYRAFALGEEPQVAIVRVPELDCTEELRAIEGTLRRLSGITSWQVNHLERSLRIQFDPLALPIERLLQSIRSLGMTPTLAREAEAPLVWWRDPHLLSTLAAGILLAVSLAAELLTARPAVSALLAGLSLPVAGWMTVAKAVRALRALRLDMNVLMSVAVLGAAAIGQWGEAASVTFLFAFAQLLEGASLARARRAVRRLLDVAPAEATVRRDRGEQQLPVDTVAPGEIILIRPGERIPLDGRVRAGASSVNQAPITGESIAVEKTIGAQVFAGSINGTGALEIEVTHRAQESMLARIIALVEDAQAQKAPTQAIVERFAAIYTPAVIAGAVALALLPWLAFAQPVWPWLYRALVLLVIACPCALVISTPVALVSALTRAARDGVLIKGGRYLEALGGIRALAMDKTGTLTLGRPELLEVWPADGKEPVEILQIAAAAEARSEHPLGGAILRAARERGLRWPPAGEYTAIPGRGALVEVGGRRYHIGSRRYAEELGVCTPQVEARLAAVEAAGRTPVVLSERGRALGILALADRLRADAPTAVRDLRRLGVRPLVILTGDVPGPAEAVRREAGLDESRAQLLPEQKVAAVRELVRDHGSVGMVGDGINDAPALAAASVGIAMGAAGTDAAIETADVTLMGDDLRQLPEAVALSRRTLAVIRANIALSVAVKSLFALLAALGQATLWMAVSADIGTSLVVICNSMRLLRASGRGRGSDRGAGGSM